LRSNPWEIREKPNIPNFDRYLALAKNWSYSARAISQLREYCRAVSKNVVTIGLAGSFGRFEASSTSDADYIMIVRDKHPARTEADRALLTSAIQKLGAQSPNAKGVFYDPEVFGTLVNIGATDEKNPVLAKRLLLLLESRPIFNDDEYDELVDKIFEKYTTHLSSDAAKEFTFLLNDLIRYFRYICVSYQENFWRHDDTWALRNLKLRHSRLIMYAGLLMLLGEASKPSNKKKMKTVRERLYLTPLERLAWAYQENNDDGLARLLGLYNVFIARLSDETWRGRIRAITNQQYDKRYEVPEFGEVKANSDALQAELTRFVFARKGSWSNRFFEYLLF
jgi:hypothetical protein